MSFQKEYKDAEICGEYRYSLRRIWEPKKKQTLFIGLNPSIADDKIDDCTITICKRFAENWGYGGILVGNLFSYRATDPKELKRAHDPIGPDNDKWLIKLSGQADKTIAIWGNGGVLLKRNQMVCNLLNKLYCLRLTKAGHPHHTRGLPRDCEPFRYNQIKLKEF